MFIAMNRFRIAPGRENDFESLWLGRNTYLKEVPGFRSFHLLKGERQEEYSLYSSHSVWDSRAAFEDWTRSEAFRLAHANAGASRDIYVGPPQFEGFEAIQAVEKA
ncbi:MAG: antibiotic biosynthesis monooxygenase [Sphingomonadaceae bacterium]